MADSKNLKKHYQGWVLYRETVSHWGPKKKFQPKKNPNDELLERCPARGIPAENKQPRYYFPPDPGQDPDLRVPVLGTLRIPGIRGAELHRRVICLAMDGDLPTVRLRPYFGTGYNFELYFQCHRFEVNQHPVAYVMPVLLKSGQSASREEAVENRNVCRSMQNS
ncbi:hypothetical protein F2Q69_00030683 [Brassica cretica]|uniref:Uncharacterized protein n=1 Tax=Brassica cretica TaxID=69181 RepID=A0A8S9S0X8_BRACR|nr:hypothetical protein F2Q69_00030683 [Brassica cretica]